MNTICSKTFNSIYGCVLPDPAMRSRYLMTAVAAGVGYGIKEYTQTPMCEREFDLRNVACCTNNISRLETYIAASILVVSGSALVALSAAVMDLIEDKEQSSPFTKPVRFLFFLVYGTFLIGTDLVKEKIHLFFYLAFVLEVARFM